MYVRAGAVIVGYVELRNRGNYVPRRYIDSETIQVTEDTVQDLLVKLLDGVKNTVNHYAQRGKGRVLTDEELASLEKAAKVLILLAKASPEQDPEVMEIKRQLQELKAK